MYPASRRGRAAKCTGPSGRESSVRPTAPPPLPPGTPIGAEPTRNDDLHVVHARAAGLDVHKLEITATVPLCATPRSEPICEKRTFSALASGLDALVAWLTEHGVEAAALEGTGVYWHAPWRALVAAGIEDWWRHGVGHGVGLDIHEAPSLRVDTGTELAVGDVVTIEPGAYRAEWGGVRVEDLVLVTESGARTLSVAPTALRVIG